VPGQGTFTIDLATGVITFTPEANFVGSASSIIYVVEDSAGMQTSSTYTPTVIGAPVANPDATSGLKNNSQSINVVNNSTSGSDSAASGTNLVESSITIACPVNNVSTTCTVEQDGSITVNGQGSYAVVSGGVIRFTPVLDFVGTALPINYTVTDNLGQTAESTYTPTVTDTPPSPPAPTPSQPEPTPEKPRPVAKDDVSRGAHNAVQVINPVANDMHGAIGVPLVPNTIRLCLLPVLKISATPASTQTDFNCQIL
jgi:CshA-type fibril repeat protein